MKRVIKFRIWDKLKKNFEDSFKESFDNRCEIYAAPRGCLKKALAEIVESDNYVVQQFTGLLDENGKEIYEGDILKEYIKNETDFNIGECKQVLGGWKIFNSKDSSICWHGWKQEVIGNVLENPELIS